MMSDALIKVSIDCRQIYREIEENCKRKNNTKSILTDFSFEAKIGHQDSDSLIIYIQIYIYYIYIFVWIYH